MLFTELCLVALDPKFRPRKPVTATDAANRPTK
jgi:hypothetical protein